MYTKALLIANSLTPFVDSWIWPLSCIVLVNVLISNKKLTDCHWHGIFIIKMLINRSYRAHFFLCLPIPALLLIHTTLHLSGWLKVRPVPRHPVCNYVVYLYNFYVHYMRHWFWVVHISDMKHWDTLSIMCVAVWYGICVCVYTMIPDWYKTQLQAGRFPHLLGIYWV